MRLTFTFLLFAVFTNIISAQTVNIQGNPYSGNPYPTITAAITAANNGDVILITGVHTESILIEKSITIRGTNPATDIIQAAAAPSSTGLGSRVINLIGTPPLALNITIENLTIRHGNMNANGGGINIDKIIGLVTLNNLIVTNNFTTINGGGIAFVGSNVNMSNCTVQNNTSTLDGGGIIAAPNNGSGVNSLLNVERSLINGNTGRNGGGIYINGNNVFGNNHILNLNLENTTISNNAATSPATGNGGGAIFVAVAFWTGNGTTGNVNLRLIHSTVYNNTHAAPVRAGLRFAGVVNAQTNFSAYNSIIVAGDDLAIKALNLLNTNTTDVVNCIIGGLESAPTLIDDVAKNNQKGRSATQAGLTGTLANLGGSTSVLATTMGTNAIDFCTAPTGIAITKIDQRGYLRGPVQDAGAFELNGTVLVNNKIYQNNSVNIFPNPTEGFVKISGLDINQIKEIKVYSILGTLEKVFNKQSELDVSDLSKGLHLVVIENDGPKIVNRIIIK
jgi:hypothetical protein